MAGYGAPRTGAAGQDETRRALEWLFGADTGVSSKTIAAVMLNVPRGAIDHAGIPHDAYDLGRCLRLLEKVPEWWPRLGEVAEMFPEWKPLVDHWSELAALYAEEAQENAESGLPEREQRMQRTYERIRALID